MRIAVTGASGPLGRGLAARLAGQGHDVVGLARHRPESWSSAADFVVGDIRDPETVRRFAAGADAVAHCAWARNCGPDGRISHEVNIGGSRNVLEAMAGNGSGRIVFLSSAYAVAPVDADGIAQACVEEMLAASGIDSVVIRSALVVGRGVDNWVRGLFARLAFPAGDRPMQVVHVDDALRLLMRAIVDTEILNGPVNLAAAGTSTLRQIAAALKRPVLPRLTSVAELELMQRVPLMDTSRLHDEWGFRPAWNAQECIEDLALGVRGRVALGRRVISLPWRLAAIDDPPAVDTPAEDGVEPRPAGPQGLNGEFDTPIDPRFPTFLATNLSEALPGPFSPSSASVTVRGLRASGVGIAERLRPGGIIQREIAMRTVGVFAHRLYGAITTAHFMAETASFVDPAMFISSSGFFGPSMASLPIFGDELPGAERSWGRKQLRVVRNIGVFGLNVVGLSAGSPRDTHDFVEDVDRLERLVGDDLTRLDDRRLLSLISLARDHVVHGWVLASGSFMLCASFNMLLSLAGGDAAPSVGPDLVSARPVQAMQRLVIAAQHNPDVLRLLAEPGERLGKLAVEAPEFHAAVLRELALIGHRGPAELEMLSTSYADDPELLVRMVTRAIGAPSAPPKSQPRNARIPLRVRPLMSLLTRQIRLPGSTPRQGSPRELGAARAAA